MSLEEEAETGSYDVTRVWSVLFWQTVYVAGVPFMMVLTVLLLLLMFNVNDVQWKEIGLAALSVATRDLGGLCGGGKQGQEKKAWMEN